MARSNDPIYPIPYARAVNNPDPIWDHYSMWKSKLPGADTPPRLASIERNRITPGYLKGLPLGPGMLTKVSSKGPNLDELQKMRMKAQAEAQAKREAEQAARRQQITGAVESIAPYASNIINSFRKAPRPATPRPYQYMRLSPVSYGASRTEADRAVYGANQGLNALGENAATAVRTANLTQGIRSVNQINEAEANQNATISNQAAQVNTQIGNSYVDAMNRYDDMNLNAQMADVQQQSANMANAADKYIAIRNQQRLADLEGQKFQVLSKIYEESGVLDRVIGDNPLDPRTQIPRMTPKAKLGAGGMLRRIDPGPRPTAEPTGPTYNIRDYGGPAANKPDSIAYKMWYDKAMADPEGAASILKATPYGAFMDRSVPSRESLHSWAIQKSAIPEGLEDLRRRRLQSVYRLHSFPAK
jgi:hypothetical protein